MTDTAAQVRPLSNEYSRIWSNFVSDQEDYYGSQSERSMARNDDWKSKISVDTGEKWSVQEFEEV